MKFRQYHLSTVLKSFESEKLPLDVCLSRYFRAHKSIGSKDRHFIGEAVYHYVRWKNLYDYLGKDPASLNEQFPLQDPTVPAHLRYGMPTSLYTLLSQAYGEKKAQEISQVSNTRAPLTVRINPFKTTRDALLERWSKVFRVSPTEHSTLGIRFHERINFFTLPEFKEGLFEIQDEASQLAALLVKGRPKQQILDYCAGAGGKTLAFAPTLENKGQIYLHDIRPAALQEARKRLKRAGIQNVQFALNSSLKGKMDWVIVDVPCTGTGTLRRNPDLKWKFEQVNLAKLCQEQRQIFQEALAYLHPQGTIVYMTCSILPQENTDQAAYFQAAHALEKVNTFQTLPIMEGMDGFYAVSFKLPNKNK